MSIRILFMAFFIYHAFCGSGSHALLAPTLPKSNVASLAIPSGKKITSSQAKKILGSSLSVDKNTFSSDVNYIDLSKTGVNKISEGAFESSAIKEIKLPMSLFVLEAHAFSKSALEKIDLSVTNVKTIQNLVFAYCSSLSAVKLSPSTSSILDYAFNACTTLSKVNLSKTKIAKIGDYAFAACPSFSKVNFPASLEVLGDFAFSMSGIEECDFSQTKLTSIGKRSFWGCTALNSFTPSASLTTISDFAFNGTALMQVDLSSSKVSSIGEGAFSNCKKLVKFTASASLSIIKPGAFASCDSLKIIDLSKTNLKNESIEFLNLPIGVIIKWGDGSKTTA
jgi:hypothetical protein